MYMRGESYNKILCFSQVTPDFLFKFRKNLELLKDPKYDNLFECFFFHQNLKIAPKLIILVH